MKLLSIFVMIMTFGNTGFAQVIPDYKPSTKVPNLLDVISPTAKKHGTYKKYKNNVRKYIYEIEMKDGSILMTNSEILRDSVSDKYFLYYSKDTLLKKVFVEETNKISRPNPFVPGPVEIEGLPVDNRWRFNILKGRINAYCYFVKNTEINEIQINGGDIISFNAEYLRSFLGEYNKAVLAWNIKDYYNAIRLFNQSND